MSLGDYAKKSTLSSDIYATDPVQMGKEYVQNVSTEQSLDNADNAIAAAQARALKRTQIEKIKKQISNLQSQREKLVMLRDQKKAELDNLSNEEIFRMAKVKGIADADVQGFLNSRISDRNYQLSVDGIKSNKNLAAAEEEKNRIASKAAHDARVEELTKELNGNVEAISKLNREIASGANRSDAEDAKVGLMDQFNFNKRKYKELTGEEWNREPRVAQAASTAVEDGRKNLVKAIANAGENFSKEEENALIAEAASLYEMGMSEADYKNIIKEIRGIIPSNESKAEEKRKSKKSEGRSDVQYVQQQNDRAEKKAGDRAEAERVSKAADEWEAAFKGKDQMTINNLLTSINKKDSAVFQELKRRGYTIGGK